MEISGPALRRTPSIVGVRLLRDSVAAVPAGPAMVAIGRRARGISTAFADAEHLMYYASQARCGGGSNKKQERKSGERVKELWEDFTALYAVEIGPDASGGLAEEIKGKIIIEAANLLIADLNQKKAQKKETKRKLKKEKATLKAAKMKCCAKDTSSSDSSDSDCHYKVIRKSKLQSPAIQVESKSETLTIAPPRTEPEEVVELNAAPIDCSIRSSSSNNITSVIEQPMNKIEVCMGGKCKRSGSMELMDELNKKIGIEGAVVGCKCMGKCSKGPNARVLNHADDAGSAACTPKNPLYLGVGIGDVDAIVANLFAEKDVGSHLAAWGDDIT